MGGGDGQGHRHWAMRGMRMLRSRGRGRSRIYLLWQVVERTKHGEEGATNKLAHQRQPRSRAPSSRNLMTCEHPKFAAKYHGPSPEARPPKPQSAPPHWLSRNLAKKPLRDEFGKMGIRRTKANICCKTLIWHSHGKRDTKQRQAREAQRKLATFY
jgi:hypothetical protein